MLSGRYDGQATSARFTGIGIDTELTALNGYIVNTKLENGSVRPVIYFSDLVRNTN